MELQMSNGTRVGALRVLLAVTLAMLLVAPGCAPGPTLIPTAVQKPIDRKIVEYPGGFVLKDFARGITAGSSIAFVEEPGDYQGALLVAENGAGGQPPRIYGWKADRTFFNIYPRNVRLPTFGILRHEKEIYGPIGGLVVSQGRIFVTHRDRSGHGVVTSFGFDGSAMTVVGDLPAQGDYGITDIAVHPTTGRLWFGLGTATNSGVVGIDNWTVGWVKRHARFCDLPYVDLKLLGYRFDTKNPRAGLFGGDDIAVTAPFQAFGSSNQLRISQAANGKPTGAIYSVAPLGGDLRVEAHGIHMPRGLAFDVDTNLYATNNGMELRGTRPVKDDPDSLLRIIPNTNTWYGWPDFSADLRPIYEKRFQPPPEMIIRTGYPELAFLIDHAASGLTSPATFRETLLFGVFPSLSGAAKFDFAPSTPAYRAYQGSAIIALSGDRAPFASGGHKLKAPVGYRVVRVDLATKQVEDFIVNTQGLPASKLGRNIEALERPMDVKCGPDGKLYILDYGKMEIREGREKITPGTGKILVLEPIAETAATPK